MQKLKCADNINVQIRGMCRLVKPPIKKGPQGGEYQPYARSKKRYLLDKKVQTGPEGGKFQTYKDKRGKTDKRYLLHKK
jgi:hypothetical protein